MARYRFSCSDAGLNCGFVTSAGSREALMAKIADHAKDIHNIREIDPELGKKVESAIKKSLF